MMSDILLKTFLIFLRLSTHKESAVDFMGVSAFGQIIYDNFIFDIPKIIDIAVLFHSVSIPPHDVIYANLAILATA